MVDKATSFDKEREKKTISKASVVGKTPNVSEEGRHDSSCCESPGCSQTADRKLHTKNCGQHEREALTGNGTSPILRNVLGNPSRCKTHFL